MSYRTVSILLLTLSLAWPGAALAQTGTTVSGTITQADGGQPLVNAVVVIDELRRETRTDATGQYRFEGVSPGEYHLGVRADGSTTRRIEVTVGTSPVVQDIAVEFDIHFAEVLSVSPTPRPQFEAYQPTTVLGGQELAQQQETTIAGTLQYSPGISTRAFGAAPARPVIRGLDGDRVIVLEDGQRMGDLSSQSADHGVPINPAAARRVEVVRGPATLLYGANAIGGLVNVVTDQIPTQPVTAPTGRVNFDLANNGNQVGSAAGITVGNGRFAFTAGGSGQDAGTYFTPEGKVPNSQSTLATGNVGGSWTGDNQYVGASYSYTDSKYGVPFIEEGNVSLTPRRHSLSARASATQMNGFFQSYRATFGFRDYEHQELEGTEVGTTYQNRSVEGELLLSHRKTANLVGTVGGWFMQRDFNVIGAEALSPPVGQRNAAAFVYEEVGNAHATFQFGGRVDRTTYEPQGVLPARDFTEWSGSAGVLLRPAAARDNLVLAASFARAARAPAMEELYFFGPHLGNFAYEIGNPTLEAERALGADVSLRARGGRFEGELTFFSNDIANYIFRNPISEDEFEEREEEFDDRFGVVHDEDGDHGDDHGDDDHHGHGEGLPFVEFVARDSRLWGMEAHGDFKITDRWIADFTIDMVRGRLKDTNEALPRIPPARGIFGLKYQGTSLQAGGSIVTASAQNRVFGEELATDGYAMLRFFASYSFVQGRVFNTITARLENATDQLYRNHLNYLKDRVAERGRTFRVVYTLGF
jgi:iron complex outermembrane receptor protein